MKPLKPTQSRMCILNLNSLPSVWKTQVARSLRMPLCGTVFFLRAAWATSESADPGRSHGKYPKCYSRTGKTATVRDKFTYHLHAWVQFHFDVSLSSVSQWGRQLMNSGLHLPFSSSNFLTVDKNWLYSDADEFYLDHKPTFMRLYKIPGAYHQRGHSAWFPSWLFE